MTAVTDTIPANARIAIIGAGPAGLTLARLLDVHGISSVIVERSSREHVEQRLRAGILEQPTVDLLTEIGLADRLHVEGMPHNGFYLRFDQATHYLDFHRYSGKHATVYGQHELVKDMIAARVNSGGPIAFDSEVTDIDPVGPQASIRYTHNGIQHSLTADFVIGADGFHGAGRQAVPAPIRREIVREYPVGWLGILAESRPVTPEGMYCPHPHGLSVHSMRGTQLSRQYLQVPVTTRLDEWTDDQIWDELAVRSEALDAGPLDRGPILDRSLAPLRSYVARGMQYGRLFLIGDAAHIVPPTGAKGLNLAVGDAYTLAHALDAAINNGDHALLDSFSANALPRIMQAQRFSALLTSTLHTLPDTDELDAELRRATLTRWVTSEDAAREIGEVYLGLPFTVGTERRPKVPIAVG